MKRSTCSLLPAVFVGLIVWGLGSALMPASAAAQSPMREFTGQIDEVAGDRLVVDNRMDDRVTFVRVDETRVEGRRTDWGDLKRKDWVTISWRFVDKPKKAYVVRVLPPRSTDE